MQNNEPKNAMRNQNKQLVLMWNLATHQIESMDGTCLQSFSKLYIRNFRLGTNLIQILLIKRGGFETRTKRVQKEKGFYKNYVHTLYG